LNTLGARDRVEALHPWLFQLVHLEKPVVAAVDGPAFGGGCNLALASDFLLATPEARFCQVFGRVGLVPDLAGFFLLPRIVGLQRAKELIFSARAVGAEEAKQLGIVYEITPADALMDRALELAGRFRHASTAAIGFAKRALNQSFNLDYHALAEIEAYAQALCIDSPYHKEAIARFNNKEQLAFDWERLDRKGRSQP
jgi:2-(1,2-epoxy-1,2-dihydrophenyl)acetyl-CoA isomerase